MAIGSSAPASDHAAGLGLGARLLAVCGILFVEQVLLHSLVDTDAAMASHGLVADLGAVRYWGLHFAIAFGVVLGLLAASGHDPGRAELDAAARGLAPGSAALRLHALLVIALAPVCWYLYGSRGSFLPFAWGATLRAALTVGAALALLTALAPWNLWWRAGRALGVRWLYAAVAATVAVGTTEVIETLWRPTAKLSFLLVGWLLARFVPDLVGDPAALTLSTRHIVVVIANGCSGLEGAGLMLTFSSAWLLFFRREYRFPRALVLVPIGLVLIFALNILRLAILLVIGDSGHPDVAANGFHSQAGWIAFCCAAGAIAFVSRRSAWLRAAHGAAPRLPAPAMTNPVATYLLPLLAVLAAGMLSRATSGADGFEPLYGLRLAAGGLALWCCRAPLLELDWRPSRRAVAAGAAVALLWVLAARYLVPAAGRPAGLAALGPAAQGLWIAMRVAGAVLLVPIAEELAYRGYLLRRVASADFESVPFPSVGRWALLLSSAAFGAAHGPLWFPALVAGAVYGGLVMRRGRIGEALAGHATSNAIIAVLVLCGDEWRLW